MLGAVMSMETVAHLQLVNGFRRDPVIKYLVELPEGEMVTLEPGDTLLNGKTWLHCLLHASDAGEGGQIPVRFVVRHNPVLLAEEYSRKPHFSREMEVSLPFFRRKRVTSTYKNIETMQRTAGQKLMGAWQKT
jgi:hypothetical protein